MLYKVDNAYNDYQTVKREVPYKEEFLENILKIVKINCKEIEIAKELWIETAKEDGLPIPEPHLFNNVAV